MKKKMLKQILQNQIEIMKELQKKDPVSSTLADNITNSEKLLENKNEKESNTNTEDIIWVNRLDFNNVFCAIERKILTYPEFDNFETFIINCPDIDTLSVNDNEDLKNLQKSIYNNTSIRYGNKTFIYFPRFLKGIRYNHIKIGDINYRDSSHTISIYYSPTISK